MICGFRSKSEGIVMFSKNNVMHIIILAVGFFTCSCVYLTESIILKNVSDEVYSNYVSSSFGNLAMALGILLFILIHYKLHEFKNLYVVSMLFSIVSIIVFFASDNVIIMSISMIMYCIFCTSGFCGAYHFALIGANVDKEYRGRVFAIGYAIASVLSYLMTLLPEVIYASYISLFIYIPLIVLNTVLVVRSKSIEIKQSVKSPVGLKKSVLILLVIIFLMSVLSTVSADVISVNSFDAKELYTYSRIFYAVGLVAAGILADKKRELFDIITLATFIYSLLAIVLFNHNIFAGVILELSYVCMGFFVIFRTVHMMNFADSSKKLVILSGSGLMLHRIVEGILVYFEKSIIDRFLITIIIETVLMCILILVYVLFFVKKNVASKNDKVKEIAVKYELSIQEEKVLGYLIQDMTNQEIADTMYLSINTIKNHNARIYKKTGMNKKELRERCQNTN
ncbi:MAG TPA: hypothetical protein DCR12_05245 [Lachnospiraceae bacterium]|nr:hypothetical protein [Lachnospiraceae bacterium]